VTLDCFMEGPNRELNFAALYEDQDFERYYTEILTRLSLDDGRASSSLILAGRRPARTATASTNCPSPPSSSSDLTFVRCMCLEDSMVRRRRCGTY
jgi:hypothetical protein